MSTATWVLIIIVVIAIILAAVFWVLFTRENKKPEQGGINLLATLYFVLAMLFTFATVISLVFLIYELVKSPDHIAEIGKGASKLQSSHSSAYIPSSTSLGPPSF